MCLSMTWVKFNGFHRRRVVHPKRLFLQPFMTLWYFCFIMASQQTNPGGVRDEPGLPVPEASLIWDFWVYLCHRILPRVLRVSRKSLQYRPNLKVTTDTLISGKFSLLQLTLFTLYKRQKINYKEQIQTEKMKYMFYDGRLNTVLSRSSAHVCSPKLCHESDFSSHGKPKY